jgi:glutaminyl-peptide cyclotransferase
MPGLFLLFFGGPAHGFSRGHEHAETCGMDGAAEKQKGRTGRSGPVSINRPPLRGLDRTLLLVLVWALLFVAGCDRNSPPAAGTATNASLIQPSNTPSAQVPMYTYEIINVWPHDPGAFTQGLVYLNGALLESTGMNGRSSLRQVDLETGKVRLRKDLSYEYFAEGLAVMDNKIFQLTWTNGKAFVYDLQSFQPQKEFSYSGEGWGLTTDGKSLIMSDGTDQLAFRDPETFKVQKTIHVSAQGKPLNRLNELEYVKGEIFANIWQTDLVARIDPASGNVVGLIDFRGLLQLRDYAPGTDVLNGIAYDPVGDRLFVTGKDWPKLFEVRLKPKTTSR